MRLEELILEWIQRAEQDVMSARFLLDMHPLPLAVIGFHAQQAEINLDRIDVCARLTPYAVDHRYPAESMVREHEVLTDLENAEELFGLIRDRLQV